MSEDTAKAYQELKSFFPALRPGDPEVSETTVEGNPARVVHLPASRLGHTDPAHLERIAAKLSTPGLKIKATPGENGSGAIIVFQTVAQPEASQEPPAEVPDVIQAAKGNLFKALSHNFPTLQLGHMTLTSDPDPHAALATLTIAPSIGQMAPHVLQAAKERFEKAVVGVKSVEASPRGGATITFHAAPEQLAAFDAEMFRTYRPQSQGR